MLEYRKRIIQIDELDKTLKTSPFVTEVQWINHDEHGFSRLIQFVTNEIVYRIEWWKNISYLQIQGDLQIPFEYVEVSSTWPNGYKTNLQFYTKGETVAILPIEKYKEEI